MDKIVNNVVIIGATNNVDKYGYKILKHFEQLGYSIFPIHPTLTQIESWKCFTDISQINDMFDFVVFVVKPEITFDVLNKYSSILKYKKLWFQPGTYDQSVLEFCNTYAINFEAKACVLKDFVGQKYV